VYVLHSTGNYKMDCIIEPFELALHNKESVNSSLCRLKPTRIKVATMTVGCKLVAAAPDAAAAADSAQQQVDIAAIAGYVAGNESHTSFRLSKGHFRNSVILSLPKEQQPASTTACRKFGVKLFANGAVHLTGLQSFGQLAEVAEQVEGLVATVCCNGAGQKHHTYALQHTACSWQTQTSSWDASSTWGLSTL
jgi:hypothetical protein